MNSSSEILFKLLRLGLGVDDDTNLPPKINCGEVVDLSFAQGVASLAVDGLQKYYEINPCSECELEKPEFED